MSLCNFAAPCAVWNTCQEYVWASIPGFDCLLFLVCKRVMVCPAAYDGWLGVTCSLLKPGAQDLPEEGIDKGDLFFRTAADSTRVK